MLENLETLVEKINKKGSIDDIIDEFVEAAENACDEGDITYDDKINICNIVSRISESYTFDNDDESIQTDVFELRGILNDLE